MDKEIKEPELILLIIVSLLLFSFLLGAYIGVCAEETKIEKQIKDGHFVCINNVVYKVNQINIEKTNP